MMRTNDSIISFSVLVHFRDIDDRITLYSKKCDKTHDAGITISYYYGE